MSRLLRVTLSDVAKAAGLSLGGTSYALRGHPRIPKETVERVRREAERLGYKPDLRVSSLMASIRRGRPGGRETLALVWVNTPRDLSVLPEDSRQFAKNILEGVRRRAQQSGCAIDQFRLFGDGLRPARLRQILVSRGISGVIFAPIVYGGAVTLDWEWSPFAAAIVGHTDFTPPLSRSAHFHFRSVWQTLGRLRDEGRKRPAIILNHDTQERIHFMQTASFVANHPDPKNAARFVAYGRPDAFDLPEKWLRETKPDALILSWQIDRKTAAALRKIAPGLRRLVTLEWHSRGVLPGIDPLNDELAANAVDLVVAQLQRNELGLPARPVSMLIDGVWVETA